jgi:hypothetical protein
VEGCGPGEVGPRPFYILLHGTAHSKSLVDVESCVF